jgi:serine/threonine protein phosphatase PrpC
MFEVYSALETGRRRTMEDECVVVHDLNQDFGLDTALYPPQALFALYDGHAGRGAVDFAVQTHESPAARHHRQRRSHTAAQQQQLQQRQLSVAHARRARRKSIRPRSTTAMARRLSRQEFARPSPSDPLLLVRPAVALRSAFLQCDEQFRKQACEEGDVSGTTAIVALLRARRLFVANAGDSRAVLCRNAQARSTCRPTTSRRRI